MDFQLSLDLEQVGATHVEEPLAATADATIGSVMEIMRAQRTGVVLLFDDDKLAGIFTERDALRIMQAGHDLTAEVRTVMSTSVATLPPTATVADAIRTMSIGGYRHLPVLDDAGTPRGVLMVQGIIHYLVDHFPETIYNLPPSPNESQEAREGA